MDGVRPPGPFENLMLPDGSGVPLYLIPYDKKGRCEGPKTMEHLFAEVRSGKFSDIHIFSHGWNNVFKEALGLYKEFFSEYFALRNQINIQDSGRYKPLLVGIVWPSTALLSEEEQGPKFAATTEIHAEALIEEQAAIRELAAEIREGDLPRFYELADLGRPLTRVEALELAQLLLPVHQHADTDLGEPPPQLKPEELVEVWERTTERPQSFDQVGRPGALPDDDTTTSSEPAAAGLLDFLNPKEIIRKANFWQMKDRAGTVGAYGVGEMLKEILASSRARVHLIGHSYGAKVVLSALCFPQHNRKVASLLLLQPAVNHLCFSENVDGSGKPGGYCVALDRVEKPILSTFSSKDVPLSKFFHWTVRRPSDLGEGSIAGAPSKYAALGGVGPGGLKPGEGLETPMLVPPKKYSSQTGVKIYGVNGSEGKINSHGDVRNKFTEWALINLVSGADLT